MCDDDQSSDDINDWQDHSPSFSLGTDFSGKLPELADGEENKASWYLRVGNADFDLWGKLPTWNFKQTSALFFGLHPKHFKWKIAEAHDSLDRRVPQCKLMRLRLKEEIFGNRTRVSSRKIIEWADANGFKFPKDLADAVIENSSDGENSANSHEFWNNLDTKQRNSILRMLASFAISQFSINIASNRLSGMQMAENATTIMSQLKVGERTMRTLLKKVADHLELDEADIAAALKKRGSPKGAEPGTPRSAPVNAK